jgi:acetyl esterase/lipase
MPADDILTLPPPAADARLPYGSDPNQFGELRVPKTGGPFPVVIVIHGGYWRAKYDLKHTGHMSAALTARGVATWNLEYRRVGNPGGGWPGTFEDIRSGYRYLSQIAQRYNLNSSKVAVAGHSAGGQLALCLAGHEASVTRVVSLAGVVDLQQACDLHLSNNAVVEFLGGEPRTVPDHYREADPMQLKISQATQWLIHGASDDTVPPFLSRNYTEQKKKRGENVHYLEISTAGHTDVIDPRSTAWPKVEGAILHLLES